MKPLLAVSLSALLLPGCGGAAIGYARVSGTVPDEVTTSLPPDIADEDLRVKDGCYYYERDGDIYPVTTLDMIRGGFADQPYCVG